MSDAITLNIVGVLAISALAFFFGPTREFGNFGRVWAAWAAFCVLTTILFSGWVIYVAAHYLERSW